MTSGTSPLKDNHINHSSRKHASQEGLASIRNTRKEYDLIPHLVCLLSVKTERRVCVCVCVCVCVVCIYIYITSKSKYHHMST
jgi:hypothetical protein